ncbi:rubrerythrin family protein [Bacillota bacterium LX-D]|nr:rubrerythrin family protein [Bacillota bacterium LX-D]
MSTEKNLKEAFAGESQANRKYLAFAQKADEEGYRTAAKLFRAAAEAEAIHASSHLKVMGEVQDTAANLQAGINGETFEFEKMYPEFIKEAEAEGNKAAVATFKRANEAEKVHAELYKKVLDSLDKNQDLGFYLCPVCGYIEINNAPDKCPICGVPGSRFKLID